MVTENEQTAVTSYQYDPNGNLYSRQTLTLVENAIPASEVSTVLMGYTAETNDMIKRKGYFCEAKHRNILFYITIQILKIILSYRIFLALTDAGTYDIISQIKDTLF